MTTKKSIEQAISDTKFDIQLAKDINDREYFEGYKEVLKKLEEAMELMKKYNLT